MFRAVSKCRECSRSPPSSIAENVNNIIDETSHPPQTIEMNYGKREGDITHKDLDDENYKIVRKMNDLEYYKRNEAFVSGPTTNEAGIVPMPTWKKIDMSFSMQEIKHWITHRKKNMSMEIGSVMAATRHAFTTIGFPLLNNSLPSSLRLVKRKANKFSSVAVRMSQSYNESTISGSVPMTRKRRPQNVDGEFFVDHTCIDCDTCRWMAPEIFTEVGYMSAVYKQPSSKEERLKALQALLSCPTNSIHTEKPPHDILEVQKMFPLPINEQRIPGVYHCGYHSEKSYGAASYLIVHPEGNILVDSPRYTERLALNIEMIGGAKYMFLTHRDDVADHKKWSKRLNCARILHSEEVNSSTTDVEVKLEGGGPWSLADDIQLVHTPGHTEGSVCLFYKSLKVLFTGDHLFMTEHGLTISERYNWFSVPVQLNSVKMLLQLDFEWILPGHGRRVEFKDIQEKNSTLEAFLAGRVHHT